MSGSFSATPIVWIHIEDPTGRLVRRFMRWVSEEDGRGPLRMCPSGTGYLPGARVVSLYRAGFSPDVADRAVKWLKKQGNNQKRSPARTRAAEKPRPTSILVDSYISLSYVLGVTEEE